MPNKIYTATESKISFRNAAAAARTVPFTPEGLPTNSGQISSTFDFGAASRPTLYRWNGFYSVSGTTTTDDHGLGVSIYWVACDETSSSGTLDLDGGFGSGNARFNAQTQTVHNAQYVGTIAVDRAGTNLTFRSSGIVSLPGRYGAVIWRNEMNSLAVSSTSGTAQFNLFPIADEVQ